METLAVAFFLSLAVALLLTPVVRWAARRSGWLDYAHTSRKIHGKPVPRLGGVAIVAAFFSPVAALLLVGGGALPMLGRDPERAIALGVGALAIAALGVYDDIHGSDAKTKFTVQIVVALGMWWAGYRVEAVTTPFGSLHLGLLGFPLTILWIVGVTNALNLIDGLDGLASGVALAATATIFWVSMGRGDTLLAFLMASLGGALLAFLVYNFNPASIFLGDSGSLFVGFVLAVTALETREKSSTALLLLVPVVALGLPIADTLLAMTRRMVRGQPVFSSDRSHIHHRLMARGLSHRATVLALYAIAVVLAGVAVALVHSDAGQTLAYVGALVTIAAMLLLAAGYVRFDRTRQLLSDRKNNLAMRAAVREAGERLRMAVDAEDVWKVVQDAASGLGASAAGLRVVTRNGTVRTSEFSAGFDDRDPGLVRARFSLLGDRADDGGIELGFSDGRSTVDRDTEIAIELLCEHVHSALERIATRHGKADDDELGNVVAFKK